MASSDSDYEKIPDGTHDRIPLTTLAPKAEVDKDALGGSDVIVDSAALSAAAAQKRRLKYGALCVLMFQSSALILTMRYSRARGTGEGGSYFASTAVLMNELLKIVICLIKSFVDIGVQNTFKEVFGEGHWKLAIPAGLYTLQNNLQYVAASNLDAATFQVTYQLKILTTAFFAVTILHKRLKGAQWLALFVLTAGVAIVQLPKDIFKPKDPMEQEKIYDQAAAHTQMVGFAAVSVACVLSGLAGIYFEKVLKRSKNVSLWVRNIQLSFYSLFPALFLGVLAQDGAEIREKGFFYKYDGFTLAVIWLQAFGGIVVALCVKYADNIAKNFATSLAILLSAVVSYFVFGTAITSLFLVGAALVIGATFWFSSLESK